MREFLAWLLCVLIILMSALVVLAPVIMPGLKQIGNRDEIQNVGGAQ
jgi:hypothetical protein